MEEIVPENQWKTASKIREWMSIYQENELYFKLGTIEQTSRQRGDFYK